MGLSQPGTVSVSLGTAGVVFAPASSYQPEPQGHLQRSYTTGFIPDIELCIPHCDLLFPIENHRANRKIRSLTFVPVGPGLRRSPSASKNGYASFLDK